MENQNTFDMTENIPDEMFEIIGLEKDEEVPARPRIGYWADAWRRFKENKVALLAGIILLVLIFFIIFGPTISGYGYEKIDSGAINQGPSAAHWFGTDDLGRDLFARVWQAGRVSLLIGITGALVASLIGSIYGGIAAYFGGIVDDIMMRIVEVLLSIPYLLIVILISVVTDSKSLGTMLIVSPSSSRGTQLKIGNDIAYANYIEDKIVNEDYSPAAVLGELKAQGKEGDFSVTVCVTTLYSYIDKGIFLKLSNKNLPVKKNKKRNYKKVQRQQKRTAAGESIDKRPKEIDTREEFGNWEMDSVLGKRGKSKNTLLVLTERKTRNEIIFKLPDHTDEAVVAALDRLERKWGADMFKRVFKTITVDNGSEFADAEGLQRSIINEGEKRTKVYYCHPYSSWERGTNEVTNKMIRRKIPKGTNFDDRTEEEVESIENWINGYPRKIHGYHSAGELFEEEVKQLA